MLRFASRNTIVAASTASVLLYAESVRRHGHAAEQDKGDDGSNENFFQSTKRKTTELVESTYSEVKQRTSKAKDSFDSYEKGWGDHVKACTASIRRGLDVFDENYGAILLTPTLTYIAFKVTRRAGGFKRLIFTTATASAVLLYYYPRQITTYVHQQLYPAQYAPEERYETITARVERGVNAIMNWGLGYKDEEKPEEDAPWKNQQIIVSVDPELLKKENPDSAEEEKKEEEEDGE